ncbi:MAG: murein L,D-transpeptidase catalytic domain-containing protein [Chitinophagales bacterium]|nr:murein L,D-transpeptidase catalytic domain family protein [Bacteroidota bacterium]
MKTLLLITGILIAGLFLQCDGNSSLFFNARKATADSLRKADSINTSLLFSKADLAKTYCVKNKFDTSICLLLNMREHSGNFRFYVWDFNTNNAVDSGLVSHGCGSHPWGIDASANNPVFSNIPESHTSSLGKYKIGKRDVSQWGVGIKYYLFGLESTNSKAYERQIVFHSWDKIPDVATYPIGAPEGWGCPAISNSFFNRIDNMLIASNKPVLLWIFNE